MPLSLSLSLLWVHGGDLQAKFALERSIRVFTGRAPTKEPRRANFMKHGAVYRERTQILDSARISLSVLSFARRIIIKYSLWKYVWKEMLEFLEPRYLMYVWVKLRN